MQPILTQPVIVENKTGATGTLAATVIASAPADGYQLLMGTVSNIALAPTIYPIKYQPTERFTPIGMVAAVPLVLVAATNLGVSDFAGFAAKLRAAGQKRPATPPSLNALRVICSSARNLRSWPVSCRPAAAYPMSLFYVSLPGLKDTPQCLHAASGAREILTAADWLTAERRVPFQAGVLALPGRKAELLFVTLDKRAGYRRLPRQHRISRLCDQRRAPRTVGNSNCLSVPAATPLTALAGGCCSKPPRATDQ